MDGDGITMPYLTGYYDTADETEFLAKFAALIAEECAKECEGLWRIDGQFTADEFADAIRAKFALSHKTPAAK